MRNLGFPLLLILTVALVAAAAERPPNILLILSDDQGYNDLGAAGSKEIKTPNLDKLAVSGVRLTSFYVTFPVCTPSRGSVLTGRYPLRNGTYDNFRNDRVNDNYLYPDYEYEISPERILGMDTREVLLSQVLRKAGYATGVFGKWDLGSLQRFLPMQRGFDDFYGFVNTGIDYWNHERYGTPSMYRRNQPTTEDKGEYTTWLFERETLRFIDEHKNEPYFVYLSYNAPHGASNLDRKIRGAAQAPGKYLDMYPSGDTLASENRRKYLASITAMDDSIGRVFERIEQHGQTGNTIVIFVSDNGGGGGSDNSPLRGKKGWMTDGGIRVPLLMRWPGQVPAGTVNDEFLSSLEIFPMLVNAAGAQLPDGVALDGFDMLPVLKGDAKSSRTEMFWHRQGEYAARVGNWKLVKMRRRGSGLYDLSEDIGEQNDLSQKMPDVLRRVRGRYEAWLEAMAAAEPRGPFKNY
jgi:arylsulfatase A-like enzyme